MFDAGSITGGLKFDMSEYAHGILEAQAVSAVFPAIVTEFLENPLLALIQVAKEAAHFVIESVEQIAASFHNTGLAAERAGVSVEWLSRLSAVAATAGVGMDSLVSGMKVLEKQAELTSEGDKAATTAFQRLGISAAEAGSLMATPQALFERVQKAISGIEDPSQRTAAALGVMGRQGFNLVPLLTTSSKEIESLGDVIEGLGGTATEEDAKIGKAFGQMEAIVSAAWLGIKKAVAEPILDAFDGNANDLLDTIEGLASQIREGLSGAFEFLAPLVKSTWSALSGLADLVGSVLVPAFNLLKPVLEIVKVLLQTIFDIIGPVLSGIGQVVQGATDSIGLTTAPIAAKGNQQEAWNNGQFHFHAHVDGIDADTASSQFAEKAIPHIHKALKEQKKHIEHAATKQHVSNSLSGGKH